MSKSFTPEQLSLFPMHKVTKSNLLIEARYSLTAGEQKLISLIVSAIQPEDSAFQVYEFPVKEVVKLMGLKSKGSYATIEGIVNSLMTKVITIRNVETGRWKKYPWFSMAEYTPYTGVMAFEIHRDLKSFFLQLQEQFTTYRLNNILDLKSFYSMRIYELLKQRQGLRERTISLQELRDYLGVNDKELVRYSHFKQCCILRPQEELNEKTDIRFEIKEHKKGRSVDSITFYIFNNEARIDVIKRIMNNNDLYPTNKQLQTLEDIFKDMTDEDVLNVTIQLRAAEEKGIFKKSIAVFLSNPEGVIKSINNGGFNKSKSIKSPKKPAADNSYELYVPPDVLDELMRKSASSE